ncbi:hypothetical protein P9222_14680 [Paenibacillus amylolyticus]|nr:hypothetical protein [Paenibacillus amylolyticus]WFR65135.1 hypothetical protein P9222_14680 [Paenibacillus amylolyticus]
MKIKTAFKLLISLSLISTMSVTSIVQAEGNKAEKAVNQISIGTEHFLVLGRDGTVWSAGQNSGQLGRESDAVFDDLKAIPSAKDMVGISTGKFSSYGITKNGKVLNWQSSSSKFDSIYSSLNNVKTVVDGYTYYAVLTTEGTVWTWGAGYYGQLGLGDRKQHDVPTLVPNLDKVTEIAVVGQTTFAIQEDGTLWGWGFNGTYQLGNGNTEESLVPVRIEIPTKIKHIYSNFNNTVAVIDVNDNVWMWGSNSDGELGDGTKESIKSPAINDGLGKVKQLAFGRSHVLALKKDGTVWAWGEIGTDS